MIAVPLRQLAEEIARLEWRNAVMLAALQAVRPLLRSYIPADLWTERCGRVLRQVETAIAAGEPPPLPDDTILDALPADIPGRNASKPNWAPRRPIA